jgi:tetratricopeptide (TPR) repeat protein
VIDVGAARTPAAAAAPGIPASSAARPVPTIHVRRPTYAEAVGQYEEAVKHLQRRDFAAAAAGFRAVLERYPDECELQERSRLYLKVCERATGSPPPEPASTEDLLFAATMALNDGRLADAGARLEQVLARDGGHEHAHYMLALVRSLRGQPDEALHHLSRAVELNPENRLLARLEHAFEPVRERHREAYRQLVEGPSPARRRIRSRAR